MSNVAEARSKAEPVVTASSLLPAVLALNTVALFALDWLGGIPNWLKTAAALFLAF